VANTYIINLTRQEKKYSNVNKLLDGLGVILYYLFMLIKNKVSKVNIFADNKIITYEVGVNCYKISLNYKEFNMYSILVCQKTETQFGLMPIDIYDRAWAIWQ